jgi:hypothetical protein
MRQNVIGFLVVLALTTAASAHQSNPGCDEVVKECREVIEAADKAINEKNYELQIHRDLLDIKDARIKDLEAWYREPKYTIPIGILLGLIIKK